MSLLTDVFGLSSETQRDIDKSIGKVRSITEYASDLSEALKHLKLDEALHSIAPWWAGPLVEAAGESIPIVKFLLKLAEKLPEKPSAKELGLVACTIAFQHAAEEALTVSPLPEDRVPMIDAVAEAKLAAGRSKPNDPDQLKGFSLDHPAAHPFVVNALESLNVALRPLGYSASEIRKLNSRIRESFKEHLKDLVTDPRTREKFAPFVQWAELGAEEDRAYHALHAHADRQRRAFHEDPVLGQEPFSLAEVYTETDCGSLKWKQIKGDGKHEHRLDAFAEYKGGRSPLLEAVLEQLNSPKLTEAIVIQGGPGAGKSSFTLRLSDELLRMGLQPIRIRIRDLRPDLPLLEALSDAITEYDDLGSDLRLPKPSSALLDGRIFDEVVDFQGARISRFILILDGWDEVSTADKGYQIQVRDLLQNVRNELLRRKNPPVRVVLTGRPSDAIAASSFLSDETPILTIRPYTPGQLESYVGRLAAALASHSTDWGAPGTGWRNLNPLRFATVFKYYRAQFDPNVAQQAEGAKSLEVLGQPLLAHLAIRVLSECESESELDQLVSSPTRLYRSLVDLTCGKAGKTAEDSGDTPQQARFRGVELRKRLHRTAAAITAWGQESIPFSELVLRARLDDSEQQSLKDSPQDRPWTRLMISFYFKGGGEHHGCEFLHKSFREYLFAEGIVEALKNCALLQLGPVFTRENERYWQDFTADDRDQRFHLSRQLSELISPQWLS